MPAFTAKPRWYCLTPDRYVLLLLVVEALLFVSNWLAWPAWHKGYAVLASRWWAWRCWGALSNEDQTRPYGIGQQPCESCVGPC